MYQLILRFVYYRIQALAMLLGTEHEATDFIFETGYETRHLSCYEHDNGWATVNLGPIEITDSFGDEFELWIFGKRLGTRPKIAF